MQTDHFENGYARGERIGPYALGGLVAIGRYTQSFVATELAGNRAPRECRVTVMAASAPEHVRRQFRAHNHHLAAIAHPGVERLIRMGRIAGIELAAFERISGRSLASLQREKTFRCSLALRIAYSIARALAHAHSKGVVHGGLDATRVWITRDGRVKVCDFALPHLRCYAPEEWSRRRMSHAIETMPQLPSRDVASLAQILLGLLDASMADGSVPLEVSELIAGACTRRPRPKPTASELAHELSVMLAA